MDLSVIVISYNESAYISECLDSILAQSYPNLEIIIGDDGSTDDSINVIKQYELIYSNISHFVMDRENVDSESIIASIRVSNVIKKALSLARGQYISLVSADDFFIDSNFYADAIDFFKCDNKQIFSAFVSGYKLIWPDNHSKTYLPHHFPPSVYWAQGYIHLSCFIFRRQVFDGGYLTERFCDDVGMEFSCGLAGKYHYFDKATFAYRQHPQSIMHKADPLELSILEILLYQDVRAKNKNVASCLSRVSQHINYLYKNRNQITSKYQKYYRNSEKYPYDILNKIRKYNDLSAEEKLQVKMTIYISKLCNLFYKCLQRLIIMFD